MTPSIGMLETLSEVRRELTTLANMTRGTRYTAEDYAMQERQIRARLDGFRAELQYQAARQC